MIKENCEHAWIVFAPATGGQLESKMNCEKCSLIMTASEAFQLEALQNQTETLKHLKGFERWMALIALGFSLLALLTSAVKR